MRQLVEAAFRPESLVEAGGEDERVGDHRPAGVVADQEDGSLRDPLQSVPLAGEVVAEGPPENGQGAPDVLGIPGVQVVAPRAAQGLPPLVRDVGADLGHPVQRARNRPREAACEARVGHNKNLPASKPGKRSAQRCHLAHQVTRAADLPGQEPWDTAASASAREARTGITLSTAVISSILATWPVATTARDGGW